MPHDHPHPRTAGSRKVVEIEVPTELAAMIGDFLPRSTPHEPTDARPIRRDACTYCGHAPHPDACPASIRTTTRPDQQRPRTARKDLA